MSSQEFKFSLSEKFINQYKDKQPEWGPLGYVTYKRSYSKDIESEGRSEEFWETVKRVVEGCYTTQLNHCKKNGLPWNAHKSQKSAQEMFKLIWDFKFLPPGRGLDNFVLDLISKKGSSCLQNCFAYNTEIITRNGVKKIGDCVNTEQELLSENGEWIKSPIKEFDKQEIFNLELKNVHGITKNIYCTANHRWFVRDVSEDNHENKPFIEVYTKDLESNVHQLQGVFHGKSQCLWEVASVKFTNRIEKVYCAVMPRVYKFALPDNIMTGNCAYISTENIDVDFKDPFSFLMDQSFLGVGVGFGLEGANKVKIKEPKISEEIHVVHDSREGWTELCSRILSSYVGEDTLPRNIDYSQIRKKGEPIKTFGGKAPGQEPLKNCIDELTSLFDGRRDRDKKRFFFTQLFRELFMSFIYYPHLFRRTKNIGDKELFMQLVSNPYFVNRNKSVSKDELLSGLPERFYYKEDKYINSLINKYNFTEQYVSKTLIVLRGIYKYIDKSDIKKMFNFLDKVFGKLYWQLIRITDENNAINYELYNYWFSVVNKASKYLFNKLNPRYNTEITSVDIVDINNILGKCVVSGGRRRTAEIAIGSAYDDEFITCKDPEYNLFELFKWRWASNNTIKLDSNVDQDRIKYIASYTINNGEPGYFWLDNAQKYGRFKDTIYYKDYRCSGLNPSLKKGTRVLTKNGIFNIEDLEDKEFQVLNINGKYSPAECFRSGVNEPLYRFALDNGIEYYCTAEHKWPVIKEGNKDTDYERIDTLELSKLLSTSNYYLPIYKVDKLYDSDNGTKDDGYFIATLLRHASIYKTNKCNKSRIVYINIDNKYDQSKVEKYLNNNNINYTCQTDNAFNNNYSVGFIVVYLDELSDILNRFSLKICSNRFEILFNNINVSEDFRKGLIDKIISKSDLKYSKLGGKEIVFYDIYNNSFIREFSELLGFYGVKCIIRGRTHYKKHKLNLSCIELCIQDIHSLMHLKNIVGNFTNEKINEYIDKNSRHLKLRRYDKVKIHAVMKTFFKDDVWDISVFDDHHCFRLPHGFTGNCGEMTLEGKFGELCNLVETFPSRHESFDEYKTTLKYAYLYAKTVTLIPTHDERTNSVMLRNRRIGLSQSGVVENFQKIGKREHFKWCDNGYEYIQQLDKKYSDWLCIPRSIKMTTVKPSGCLTSNALINTTHGILTINELFKNHNKDKQWSTYIDNTHVYQDNNETSKILRTYNNGLSDIIEITLGYNMKLKCTPNHKWFVKHIHDPIYNTYKPIYDWVKAKDLKLNYVLDINLNVYKGTNDCKLNNLYSEYPNKMNKELAWFIGYLLGKNSRFYTGTFTFTSIDEPNVLNRICDILRDRFNIKSIIRDEYNNKSTISVHSLDLYKWLNMNDIDITNVNEIPKCIRQSSRNSIISFISGYIDSSIYECLRKDSDFCGLSSIVFDTQNYEFANHFQHVAASVGLTFELDSRKINNRIEYLLDLAHVSYDSFYEFRTNSMVINRRTSYEELKEFCEEQEEKSYSIMGKINKLENLENQEYTYDIEIENDHWYYNGPVKSHNTVSLLPQVTPGIHYPHSKYYYRLIRIPDTSELYEPLKKAGYRIEKSVYGDSSYVVYFAVKEKNFDRSKSEVSIWEQVENAAKMNYYWSDNSVSCTVTFDPETESKDIPSILELYGDRLKSISFLPISNKIYPQAPYQEISEKEYNDYISNIKDVSFNTKTHEVDDKFCDGDSCVI